MAAMRLHDYWIASSQRGSGVSSCHRKSEREVARTKNNYRPDGHEHPPQIRFWRRLPVWNGMIDPGVNPRAFARDLSKQPQLPDGAGAFAREPRLGKSGFQMCSLYKLVAQR